MAQSDGNAEICRSAGPDKGPEMVVIPGGEYMMGSIEGEGEDNERPRHPVTIAPFAIGRCEVTVAEFQVFVEQEQYATESEASGEGCWIWNAEKQEGERDRQFSWRSPGFEQSLSDPVVCISYNDAQAYIAWLNKNTGAGYRLPSESEWEYVARAGSETRYWWGDQAGRNWANYGKDECCDGEVSGEDSWLNTAPVGSFAANPHGVYDTAGNVYEWVEDCWHEDYTNAPKGGAWLEADNGDCGLRVLRGGSWNDTPDILRSANRFRFLALEAFSFVGFRLARTLQ